MFMIYKLLNIINVNYKYWLNANFKQQEYTDIFWREKKERKRLQTHTWKMCINIKNI